MEKRSTAAGTDVKAVSRFLKQNAADANSYPIDGHITRLAEFLGAGREHLKLLRGRLHNVEQCIEKDGRTVGAMVDGLLEDAKQISLTPFSMLFRLSAGPLARGLLFVGTGKRAELSISGGDIEVDRRILEGIKDPLVHLVRNCVDHGIEKPGDRVLKGKPAMARISVAVSRITTAAR